MVSSHGVSAGVLKVCIMLWLNVFEDVAVLFVSQVAVLAALHCGMR